MNKTKSGDLLKKYRKKRKMKQREIAAHFGWTTSMFVSNLERGKSALPPKQFKTWSKLLGIPLNKLVEAHVADYKAKVWKVVRG